MYTVRNNGQEFTVLNYSFPMYDWNTSQDYELSHSVLTFGEITDGIEVVIGDNQIVSVYCTMNGFPVEVKEVYGGKIVIRPNTVIVNSFAAGGGNPSVEIMNISADGEISLSGQTACGHIFAVDEDKTRAAYSQFFGV